MVWGLVVVLAFGQAGSKADITRSLSLWKEFGRPVPVDLSTLKNRGAYSLSHFLESRELVTALRQAENGDLKPINEIKKSLTGKAEMWDRQEDEWLGLPNHQNLEGRTAMLIYRNSVNQYLDGRPPVQVLDRLKQLQRKDLIGKRRYSDRSLDTFVSELSETVKTSEKPPGTMEYAIDQLSNLTESRSLHGNTPKDQWDPKEYQAIEAFGLDGIPALANLLGSKKLTRSFRMAFHNSPAQIVHLDVVVEDIVLRLADEELASRTVDKETVLGWFDAKKKGKVKEWIVSRLFVESKHYPPYGDPIAFRSLGKKYPELLKSAYEEMIRRKIEPAAAIWGLEESNLSKTAKLEILEMFLALDIDQVGSALESVRTLDQSRYDRAIIRYIDKLPSRFDLSSYSVFYYAMGTGNPEVWRRVKSKIDHSDPLTKMQLLSFFGGGDWFENVHVDLVMRLLARYFDSKAVASGTNINEFRALPVVDWKPGLTVGQVALEMAASKGQGMWPQISRKDKAGWRRIRKEIEAKYKLGSGS